MPARAAPFGVDPGESWAARRTGTVRAVLYRASHDLCHQRLSCLLECSSAADLCFLWLNGGALGLELLGWALLAPLL